MIDGDTAERVSRHYTPSDLSEAFDKVLESWGKANGPLTPDDLAPLDHFHVGGKAATLALARIVNIGADTRVLDVGGGFGGPARTLAATYGCSVTVLDVTEAYCQVGEQLTARCGLSDRVIFRNGNALAMPFPDRSFDLIWTQHSSMNIADKRRLYEETFRVLRPGGQLGLYEVMAGPNQPVLFPVPWAADPSISFLAPPEQVQQMVTAIGFDVVGWEDLSATVGTVVPPGASPAGASQPVAPPASLHLILGPDFIERGRNLMRNFAEKRVALIQAVLARS